MPALAWTSFDSLPQDGKCIVMASRLPLRRYRSIPAFVRSTLRIRGQLANAEGLIGYALNAQLVRRVFWTVSAWTDESALAAFSRADPHRSSVDSIRHGMAPTTFVTWTAPAEELPISWAEVRERLTSPERGA